MRGVRRFGWALVAVAAFAVWPVVAAAVPESDVVVREGGTYALERYTTSGARLQRYTGFNRITGVRVYDDTTALVAEDERDTISAMTLDGHIIWVIPVHRPRSLTVLGPDRFLVSQDDPPGVAEVDRAGTVLWHVSSPLHDAAGAVRLPDGNTAVVQGRGPYSVDVISPDGRVLWTGTQELAQPRALVRLPSGEIATSGFDSGKVVIFRPFTTAVRWLEFPGHGEDLAVTQSGELLTFSPESQLVRGWEGDKIRWQFNTRYPALHGDMLPDGTVLVAVFREPDRACLNAASRVQRAQRPLALYWIWLGAGLIPAMLLVVVIQYAVLRSVGSGLFVRQPPGCAAQSALVLPRRRALELGVYVVAAVSLAAAAAMVPRSPSQFWLFAGLAGAGGVVLALLRYRTPVTTHDWSNRMARLAPMTLPTRRMWALWITGGVLVAVGLYGVFRGSGEWVLAPWSAGLVLLAGGSLQPREVRLQMHWGKVLAGLLGLAVLCFIRVYRLEEYPANLHLDMAQWSVQVLQLIDGDVPTVFTNGWAEIPLLGYFWSALWTEVGGRSLAACRFASVVGSLTAIVAVFFLVRRMFGMRAAAIAAVLLGVNHGFLHFSRIQHYMDPVPFHVLGVLGLVAGLETGRYGWFALAGLAGGYSALTYHAGRITPPAMLVLTTILLLRFPRALARRWRGLLLCTVLGLGMLGPQALIYARGGADPFGRGDQYAWIVHGTIDAAQFSQTVAQGVPRVLGTFWTYVDSSTQFGGLWSVFLRPLAALAAMGAVAALLRPSDIGAAWVALWAFLILFVGGVLTRDPPFWPRFVTSFAPAVIVVAVAIDWICRAVRVALGRVGARVALAAVVVFVGIASWQHVDLYVKYCLGIPADQTHVSLTTQWVQGIMGRDLQRWGKDAMVYIVARNNVEHSCAHPTIRFYAYEVDVQDARGIGEYLPFKDPRTVVSYVLPDSADQIDEVRHRYPTLQETPFYNNLGTLVFTRVVVAAPHA